MFEAIRSHRRILFFVMIILIIPSFVFFGIDGYTRFRDNGRSVAMLAGDKITQAEFDVAHRTNTERLQRLYGERFDVKLADTPEARQATLDELIRERLVIKTVRDNHLSASDAKVFETMRQDPSVAALKKPDGSIDLEALNKLLSQQGYSAESYMARIRAALSGQSVLQSVVSSSFVPAAGQQAVIDLRGQRREIQTVLIKASDFVSQIQPTDEQLETYFKANPKQYQIPEQADIEYVVFDLKSVQDQLALNAEDVKTYYEQNKDRYKQNERRRVSHILIGSAVTDKAEVKAAAKAKAESLLAQVKASPASFAELAKKNSQDSGSAEKGGDLDFISRGSTVGPFDKVAFELKQGEISNVVESEFGFHVMTVTAIEPERTKAFEETKADIETELKRQKAQARFSEDAEKFSNAVYEQSDGFVAIAEKLKLKAVGINGIGRTVVRGAPPGNPLGNAKFMDALFSEESLKTKRNTQAIDLGNNTLASARILKYTAATVKPLAEVKDVVRASYIAEESAKRATAAGEAKLAEVKAKPDALIFEAPSVIGRGVTRGLGGALSGAVFKLDGAKLPAYTGVEVPGEGYRVVKVIKLAEALPPNPQLVAQEAKRINDEWASAESALYIKALRKRFDVEAKPMVAADKPAAAASAAASAKK